METIPEATAGMYDEVAYGSLSLFFLQQRVVAAEEFHRQSVVGHVEHGPQLIAEVDVRQAGLRCFRHLLFGVLVGVRRSFRPVLRRLRVRVLALATSLDVRANFRFVVEAAPAGSSTSRCATAAESGVRPRVHGGAEAAVQRRVPRGAGGQRTSTMVVLGGAERAECRHAVQHLRRRAVRRRRRGQRQSLFQMKVVIQQGSLNVLGQQPHIEVLLRFLVVVLVLDVGRLHFDAQRRKRHRRERSSTVGGTRSAVDPLRHTVLADVARARRGSTSGRAISGLTPVVDHTTADVGGGGVKRITVDAQCNTTSAGSCHRYDTQNYIGLSNNFYRRRQNERKAMTEREHFRPRKCDCNGGRGRRLASTHPITSVARPPSHYTSRSHFVPSVIIYIRSTLCGGKRARPDIAYNYKARTARATSQRRRSDVSDVVARHVTLTHVTTYYYARTRRSSECNARSTTHQFRQPPPQPPGSCCVICSSTTYWRSRAPSSSRRDNVGATTVSRECGGVVLETATLPLGSLNASFCLSWSRFCLSSTLPLFCLGIEPSGSASAQHCYVWLDLEVSTSIMLESHELVTLQRSLVHLMHLANEFELGWGS